MGRVPRPGRTQSRRTPFRLAVTPYDGQGLAGTQIVPWIRLQGHRAVHARPRGRRRQALKLGSLSPRTRPRAQRRRRTQDALPRLGTVGIPHRQGTRRRRGRHSRGTAPGRLQLKRLDDRRRHHHQGHGKPARRRGHPLLLVSLPGGCELLLAGGRGLTSAASAIGHQFSRARHAGQHGFQRAALHRHQHAGTWQQGRTGHTRRHRPQGSLFRQGERHASAGVPGRDRSLMHE